MCINPVSIPTGAILPRPRADATALPRYVQIAEMLIREVAAGRRLPGERLPPERDFAADLGVSVGTLRRALGDLEAKGLLERRQGSGNYIRSGSQAASVYAFFRLELIAGGGLPTAEVLTVDRLPKPADALAFGPAPDAHRIRRLRRLDALPAALEEIWLDGARAATVRREDLSHSLYLFYRERLGLVVLRVEDRVGVATVPGWGLLGCAAGSPCGHVERISWDGDGARAEYSRTWFDPSVARYVSRMG